MRPARLNGPELNLGYEHPIRNSRASGIDSLILTSNFFDSYDNYILLCIDDGRVVCDRPQEFTPATLMQLKVSHENSINRIINDSTDARPGFDVRLLLHTAMFIPSSPAYYFLKIINESHGSTARLNLVWFATNPEVVVDNHQRPLPALLAPGELFETWQPVQDVPAAPHIEYLARAQLGDGTIIESRPNIDVSPAGMVGGGGRPLTDLIKSVTSINHDGDQLIEKEWDLFISHAQEDKDEVVRPLVHALQERGLHVWYDEFEVRIGSSLRRKIDQGIAQSTFGVVVLSPAFFSKEWTNYELDGLVTRSTAKRSAGGGQVILPIWHNVTFADVMQYSPSLADKVARDTSQISVERIADEIREVVTLATVKTIQ